MENADKEFFAKTFKDEESRDSYCMYPGCQEKAINSHVFQQNGILSEMAIDRHVIVMEPPDIWTVHTKAAAENISLNVKKKGIKIAYSFPGFCNAHDTQIFTPIETNIEAIDFSDYKNQILFSYRGLCNELYRKKVGYAFQEKMLNYLLDLERFDGAEYISYSKNGLKAGIESLEKFKINMESDIFNSSDDQNFIFQVFEFPRFDVGISVTLSVLPQYYSDLDGIRDYENGVRIANQFINIFPLGDKSIVIIGEQRDLHSDFFDYLINKFSKCHSFEDYKVILSDLITARLEFWCMSPKLFASLNKEKLNKYIKFFNENINSHIFNLHSGINIFN